MRQYYETPAGNLVYPAGTLPNGDLAFNRSGYVSEGEDTIFPQDEPWAILDLETARYLMAHVWRFLP